MKDGSLSNFKAKRPVLPDQAQKKSHINDPMWLRATPLLFPLWIEITICGALPRVRHKQESNRNVFKRPARFPKLLSVPGRVCKISDTHQKKLQMRYNTE
jgi:hypothetical protein